MYINEKEAKMQGLTEQEIEKLKKEREEEAEKDYKEKHFKICPSCGKQATNIGVNGAGIVEELAKFECDFCGWKEN
ncbi:hypothetical protein SAMN02745134_00824 [Clostridium acidisoli DSM 12555]|uniref:Uncharacterized protein n=1 Tax=Clostridium acidisoli DSM 12555 TaxID=1121291 RepID=A0A1W1X653_9CLOT|nr:hypothetical protein [Clostridium acidisoli]SMC19416.1 hypothetical protein SAMN02745134_00824 [Clostridium acidisoli DSM 12555]